MRIAEARQTHLACSVEEDLVLREQSIVVLVELRDLILPDVRVVRSFRLTLHHRCRARSRVSFTRLWVIFSL